MSRATSSASPLCSLLTETNSPALELSSFRWFPDTLLILQCLQLVFLCLVLGFLFLQTLMCTLPYSLGGASSLCLVAHTLGELPLFATPNHGLCFSSLLTGGQLPFPSPPQTQGTTFPWKPGSLPLDCYYSCHLFIGCQDFFLFAGNSHRFTCWVISLGPSRLVTYSSSSLHTASSLVCLYNLSSCKSSSTQLLCFLKYNSDGITLLLKSL